MKVNTKQLQQYLKTLQPAVSSSGYVDDLKSVYFTGKTLAAFNNQIYISIPFETHFTGSVPGKEFNDVMQKIKSEEVDLELDKTCNSLYVKGGKTKASLVCNEIEEGHFALKFMDTEMDWKPLSRDFMDGINLVKFSTEKNDARPQYNCVFVDKNTITGASNTRAFIYTLSDDIEDSFLIPVSVVNELSKFENITHFCYAKPIKDVMPCLYFKDEHGIIFFSSTIDTYGFPNCAPVFEGEGSEIIFPEEIKKAIQTAAIFTEELDIQKKIDIEFDGKEIICRGERKGLGWVEECIETETDYGKFGFRVNPIFFSQILNLANTAICTESKSDGNFNMINKLIFKTEKFKHVLMLWKKKVD